MSKANNINPSMLAWARETAGLDMDEAAKRLGIASSETATAAEKLAEMEAGTRVPARSLLSKFASIYHRPLLTFYMKTPPARGDRGEDFRRAPGAVPRRENAMLDTLLRDIRARQEMVRELLIDDDSAVSNPFVGSARLDNGVLSLVNSIARALDFDPAAPALRKGNADDLFKLLRRKTEAAGIFVLLVGDLGSHHSAISADVFRGFAIADEIAPFVVVNDQDALAARSFTLIHELAHLWLGQTGVSGKPEFGPPVGTQERVERFCNDVAGEFLLPGAGLGSKPGLPDSSDVWLRAIAVVAERWSVSEPMAAYRLRRLGWFSSAVYEALVAIYVRRWQASRAKARLAEGGPSYYVVRQAKLGNALLEVVRRTLRGDLLTHTKAAKILGVRPGAVEPLLRRYEGSQGAIQGAGG